ncbi:Endonuclease/exonuclease/phosphatase [Desulfurispirillum indicum S5]|uniref:Endonuclease/exonuclease/phosphatase n=1 Tax=Desulfurispirillum indicum (strain ATCC BAA-1389 / DSM 22839 / S5) TaxID=653733 RepID=E6W321_DESIS|nr:ExeM/NucH family extracellular endonuclease [Desulfurispirillum indicum]ADU65682.1 Endonuclease/exonuclease/phosphatase [Desulfurispirillum indicum S5]
MRISVIWGAILALFLNAFASACPLPSTASLAEVKAQSEQTINRSVRVDGVVSGVFTGRDQLGGFYLQQPSARKGQLPAGIFVYAPRLSGDQQQLLRRGAHIQLQATVSRFRGNIQLTEPQQLQSCGMVELVPVPFALPLPAAQRADYTDLLVHIPGPLTVTSNFDLLRYGSLLLSSEGRLIRPTQHSAIDEDANHHRSIILDDGSYRAYPDPVPYLDALGTRRVGTTLPEGVKGILTHAFDEYRLHPVQEPQFRDDNPRPAPPPAPEPGHLRVATFNMENYFVTPGRRGASNQRELQRQRSRLLAAFHGLDADVVALMEMENHPRALQDWQQWVSRTQSDSREYRVIAGPDPGSDAIQVVLVYDRKRLELMGVDSLVDGVFQRHPVVGHFRDRGSDQRFSVIGVHFKSKTRCPAEGDVDLGQGCWNLQRTQQARMLLQQLGSPAESRFLIAGDLNAYGREDPVRLLQEAGMVNSLGAFDRQTQNYTYIFFGQSGTLDYIFRSSALNDLARGGGIWHINVDEPPFLSYQNPQHSRSDEPWRSSDHDPVWADFAFD